MTTERVRPIPTINALLIAALPIVVIGACLAAAQYVDGAEAMEGVATAVFVVLLVLFPGWLGDLSSRSTTPNLVLWIGAALPALAMGTVIMRSRPFRGYVPTEPFAITDIGVISVIVIFCAVLLGAWTARRSFDRGHPVRARFLGAVVEWLILAPLVFGSMFIIVL